MVKLCHREVYQSDGSQGESTSTNQGPYDHNLPVIRACLEENPGRDENDTEEDCNQDANLERGEWWSKGVLVNRGVVNIWPD